MSTLASAVQNELAMTRRKRVEAAKKLFCAFESCAGRSQGSILGIIDVLYATGNIHDAEDFIGFVYKYYDTNTVERMALIEDTFSDETGVESRIN
jgi:hypothetical protein